MQFQIWKHAAKYGKSGWELQSANLEKGIAVLEYLSLRSAGETLQDIKSALDISQTTAYRILNTLVRLEYLIFSEDTKRYKLSRKLLTLGFRSFEWTQSLRDRLATFAWFTWSSERDRLLWCLGRWERDFYRTSARTSYVPLRPVAGKAVWVALFGSRKGDYGLFAEDGARSLPVLHDVYTV